MNIRSKFHARAIGKICGRGCSGSAWAGILESKRGDEKGPTVMVAGHMDEVGFMVTQITENGMIRLPNTWWLVEPSSSRGQRVHFYGSRSNRRSHWFDSTSFIE